MLTFPLNPVFYPLPLKGRQIVTHIVEELNQARFNIAPPHLSLNHHITIDEGHFNLPFPSPQIFF